jgi:hypothetical protein
MKANVDNFLLDTKRTGLSWMQVKALNYTGLRQEFKMFDNLLSVDQWFVFEGELANGTTVDLFFDAPVRKSLPKWGDLPFPMNRWRKVQENLLLTGAESLRKPLAEFVFRKWNESHDSQHQAVRLRLICYSRNPRLETPEAESADVLFAEVTSDDYHPVEKIFDELDFGQPFVP